MRRSRVLLLIAALAVPACSSDSGDEAGPGTSTDGSSATTAPGDTSTATSTDSTATAGSSATPVETDAPLITQAPVTTVAPTTTTPPSTYTVVAGDSLFRIADRNCMTPEELIAANGWDEGLDHVFLPGDVVQITPGACDGGTTEATVPADYTLPYAEPVARTSTTPECDAAFAAFDVAFAGPPTESTADAARAWMVDAMADLSAALAALGDRVDLGTSLTALEEGEPELAAAYVDFVRDTTNGTAYAAMAAALEPVGVHRFVVATQLGSACTA